LRVLARGGVGIMLAGVDAHPNNKELLVCNTTVHHPHTLMLSGMAVIGTRHITSRVSVARVGGGRTQHLRAHRFLYGLL